MARKLQPMWIGLELPLGETTLKVCVGIDQEAGNEVSFCNNEDIAAAGTNDPWITAGVVTVSRGSTGRVFDDEHNLVTADDMTETGNEETVLFPNSFENWVETHHEIVEQVMKMANWEDDDAIPEKLLQIREQEGMGGFWLYCRRLTDMFEKEYAGREWDGEWLDTLTEWLQQKICKSHGQGTA